MNFVFELYVLIFELLWSNPCVDNLKLIFMVLTSCQRLLGIYCMYPCTNIINNTMSVDLVVVMVEIH